MCKYLPGILLANNLSEKNYDTLNTEYFLLITATSATYFAVW